jgi:hypothetical protein
MAVNDQYRPGMTPFGTSEAIAHTGAPGTPGITAAESAGPVVGTPVVSDGWASAQVPANLPTVEVLAGDSSGMSSDAPVPAGGDPLTGLGLDAIASTGAGSGSVQGAGNPNAQPVGSLAAQIQAARRTS